MLLAVDIGNTNTVLALFDRGGLLATWRIGTDRRATADDLAFKVRGLLGPTSRRSAESRRARRCRPCGASCTTCWGATTPTSDASSWTRAATPECGWRSTTRSRWAWIEW